MKLDAKEFARFKELSKKFKGGKLTEAEKEELAQLTNKKRSERNDVSWYVKGDTTILSDVASKSFGTYPGQGLRLGKFSNAGPEFTNTVSIRAYFIPGVGTTASDGLNLAGRKNYTYVRSKNSGAKNYEAPDMIIYNMGYLYCLLGLAMVRRLVGSVKYFSTRNKSVPEAIVRAQGFNYSDTITSLPMIRSRLNLLCRKLSSLAVPVGQTIINRWIFLVENIFCDHADDKAVSIVITPEVLLKYHPNTVKTGGALMPESGTDMGNGPFNAMNFLSTIEGMIDALIADDDSAMISGDQMKAYDDQHIVIAETPEDFVVTPVYSEELLLQIHNARHLGGNLTYDYVDTSSNPHNLEDHFAIKQESGIVICDPYVLVGADENANYVDVTGHSCGASLLDIWKEHPAPADVMEMTRFNYVLDTDHVSISTGGANQGYVPIGSCGTEIITYIETFNYDDQGSLVSSMLSSQIVPLSTNLTGTWWSIAPLDWHPAFYRASGTAQVASSSGIDVIFDRGLVPICDVSNFTTIEDNDYIALNKLAVYAELLIGSM